MSIVTNLNILGLEGTADVQYVREGLIIWFDSYLEPVGTKNFITNLVNMEKHSVNTNLTFNRCILNIDSTILVNHSPNFVYSDNYHTEMVAAVESNSSLYSTIYAQSINRWYNNSSALQGNAVRLISDAGQRSGIEKNYKTGVSAIFNTYTPEEMTKLSSYSFAPYANVLLGSLRRNNAAKAITQTGIAVGQYVLAGYSTNDKPFSAKFACLRIYDRELTDAEIAYNYEIDKRRFGI